MAYENSVAVIGVGILFFLGILATQVDKKHSLLKMFYLIMGLWFCVGLLNVAQLVVTANGGSSGVYTTLVALYWSMMTISFFTTFYMVFYYVKEFVETLRKNKLEARLNGSKKG